MKNLALVEQANWAAEGEVSLFVYRTGIRSIM
jgi:hypothetical protein